MRARIAQAVVLAALSLTVGAHGGTSGLDCNTTPRAKRPPTPDLAKLSGSWWVQNRVWMGVAGAFHGGGFRALPRGQKIGWWRERPGALRLYGKRLDGESAIFESEIACCYGRLGFQPSGVRFGQPGCWALTAVVGTRRSRFVVRVAPAPD